VSERVNAIIWMVESHFVRQEWQRPTGFRDRRTKEHSEIRAPRGATASVRWRIVGGFLCNPPGVRLRWRREKSLVAGVRVRHRRGARYALICRPVAGMDGLGLSLAFLRRRLASRNFEAFCVRRNHFKLNVVEFWPALV